MLEFIRMQINRLILGPKESQTEIRLSQTECYEPVVVALGAGRFHRIVVASLTAIGGTLSASLAQPVEAASPVDEQGWPALSVALICCVAWI